jgi:hypothetical protein
LRIAFSSAHDRYDGVLRLLTQTGQHLYRREQGGSAWQAVSSPVLAHRVILLFRKIWSLLEA